jgi:hypothetical protein
MTRSPHPMRRFDEALRVAGESAQTQVFDHGGHGFGVRRQGTDSDRWIAAAYSWLSSKGLVRRRAP